MNINISVLFVSNVFCMDVEDYCVSEFEPGLKRSISEFLSTPKHELDESSSSISSNSIAMLGDAVRTVGDITRKSGANDGSVIDTSFKIAGNALRKGGEYIKGQETETLPRSIYDFWHKQIPVSRVIKITKDIACVDTAFVLLTVQLEKSLSQQAVKSCYFDFVSKWNYGSYTTLSPISEQESERFLLTGMTRYFLFKTTRLKFEDIDDRTEQENSKSLRILLTNYKKYSKKENINDNDLLKQILDGEIENLISYNEKKQYKEKLSSSLDSPKVDEGKEEEENES